MIYRITNMCPAEDWFARTATRRIPLACWITVEIPIGETTNYEIRGVVPTRNGGLVAAEMLPGFMRYEHFSFDAKQRIDPEAAKTYLRDKVTELDDSDIRRHIENRKASVILQTLAELDLETEFPEAEEPQ